MMLVVSDTSPLTSLLQVERAPLLAALFGKVLVPLAVSNELLRFHMSLPSFVEIHPVRDHETVAALSNGLGAGESEAIVLAEEMQADYLLMDDNLARLTAESRGVRVIGLLGILVIAKKSGLIDSVGTVIEDLEVRARFFVSETVKQIILHAAGESS